MAPAAQAPKPAAPVRAEPVTPPPVEEPVYAVAANPAPTPRSLEKTAKAAPAPVKPRPPAPPAPVAETQILEETPAPRLMAEDAEVTLEMAAPMVEPAEVKEPLQSRPAAQEKRRESADDTDPTPRSQTAFDYQPEAGERVETQRRPHRSTGPHQVPQLHPGLGAREEDKWDIPAFIRRQQRTTESND